MVAAFVRRLDNLGRLVLPIALRKRFGLEAGSALEVFADGERMVLRPYRRGCVRCGGAEDLVPVGSELACRSCLRRLVEAPGHDAH